MADAPEPKKCGKCNGKLDRDGEPNWCKSCWAKYQREYKATKEEMIAGKAWADSALATKTALARAFATYPNATFIGQEAARLIMQFTPPKRVTP